MNLYINNHSFHYELENLARLFFPNEKISVTKDCEVIVKPYIFTQIDNSLTVTVSIGEYEKTLTSRLSDDVENERMMCQLLYEILCDFTGITPPWGMITGVRPVKLYRKLKETDGEAQADKYFTDKLFVSKEKLEFAKITEKVEKQILDLSQDKSFSLYIAIPFCPSRCNYCSFVQSSVERSKHLIDPYVDLLCEELKKSAEIANKLGLKLETAYMGGGTPTTLSAEQLNRVLSTVNSCFDTENCREFTVEAGRPDTITPDKLNAIKENKVDRISINPQTLNDNVLEIIGRKHNSQQFFDSFEMARKVGFDSINTDLIAGLTGDTYESFVSTLNGICELDPECVTIHTLSMKRSSTLTKEGSIIDTESALQTAKMLDYAKDKLFENDYLPYYLYRQSRMVGNLENTGWSKKGKESLYNVYVMDETHTIIGCGAGAVTKLKTNEHDYLQRIFNFKYPYEYIGRFDEMIERKNEIIAFYDKYFNF